MKKIIQYLYAGFTKIHPLEIIAAVAVIGAINYYKYPDDPGFLNTHYNPYFVVILFFAVFYGKTSGLFALLFSVISIVTGYLLVFPEHTIIENMQALYNSPRIDALYYFLFISALLAVILGETRDSIGLKNAQLQEDKDLLLRQNEKKNQEIQAISLVNEEYQDRILGQQSSLISLYATMVSLNSLDLESIYPHILEAVHKFSGATRCSLWQYNTDTHELVRLATYGWDNESISGPKIMEDKKSIYGWVARNNVMFSVKMLQKYKNLQEADERKNIITAPITIENQVWGIINIEEMPFVKYNLYSEQLIMMISDLASPVIKNALRFSDLTKVGEVDKTTGFHSIDEMFVVLKEEFNRAVTRHLNLSLIIVEIINADQLLEEHGRTDVLHLLNDISQMVIKISNGHALIFQYKETFQFATILPGMDFDGCAMFSLNLIEEHSKSQYNINKIQVTPEILIGYSSYRTDHKSEEDMVFLADNLLMLQKV